MTTHIAYYLTRDGEIHSAGLDFAGADSLVATPTYKTLAMMGRGHVVKVECYTDGFRPTVEHSDIVSQASPLRIGMVHSWAIGGDLKAIAAATEKAGGTMDDPLPLIQGDIDLEEIDGGDELTEAYALIRRTTCDAYRAACDAYHAVRAPFVDRAHKLADKARCHVVVRDSRGEIHILAAPSA